ncbi:MAG: hypothetical protein ACRC1T_13140 [Clostridium chrysemydis]|uniref:hypothetical protein n=1 Tax=Clostridium chrysemydis TaxID=2665504 RepID=UPI003F409FEC
MLRSVEEIAIELGVSKTSIYNKLKLKEFKSLVVKKQGKSMVDDDLLNLIKDNLRLKNEVENLISDSEANEEISMDEDSLLNFNQELISGLLEQLKEKDKQISELHKLIENSQVLLKEEKQNYQSQLLLESHFQEVDQKLQAIMRDKMENKKSERKSFFKIFK